MLQEVFYWVFNMSIAAAITGVMVMLVRLVKRIPRRFTVFLWAVPFFRMTIPLGLSSPYSLMSLISRITTKTVIYCISACRRCILFDDELCYGGRQLFPDHI